MWRGTTEDGGGLELASWKMGSVAGQAQDKEEGKQGRKKKAKGQK